MRSCRLMVLLALSSSRATSKIRDCFCFFSSCTSRVLRADTSRFLSTRLDFRSAFDRSSSWTSRVSDFSRFPSLEAATRLVKPVQLVCEREVVLTVSLSSRLSLAFSLESSFFSLRNSFSFLRMTLSSQTSSEFSFILRMTSFSLPRSIFSVPLVTCMRLSSTWMRWRLISSEVSSFFLAARCSYFSALMQFLQMAMSAPFHSFGSQLLTMVKISEQSYSCSRCLCLRLILRSLIDRLSIQFMRQSFQTLCERLVFRFFYSLNYSSSLNISDLSLSTCSSLGYSSLRISVVLKESTYLAFSSPPIWCACSSIIWFLSSIIASFLAISFSSSATLFSKDCTFSLSCPASALLSSASLASRARSLRWLWIQICAFSCSSSSWVYLACMLQRKVSLLFCISRRVTSFYSQRSMNRISRRFFSSRLELLISSSRPHSCRNLAEYSSRTCPTSLWYLASTSSTSFSYLSFCQRYSCSRLRQRSFSISNLRSYIFSSSVMLLTWPASSDSNTFSCSFSCFSFSRLSSPSLPLRNWISRSKTARCSTTALSYLCFSSSTLICAALARISKLLSISFTLSKKATISSLSMSTRSSLALFLRALGLLRSQWRTVMSWKELKASRLPFLQSSWKGRLEKRGSEWQASKRGECDQASSPVVVAAKYMLQSGYRQLKLSRGGGQRSTTLPPSTKKTSRSEETMMCLVLQSMRTCVMSSGILRWCTFAASAMRQTWTVLASVDTTSSSSISFQSSCRGSAWILKVQISTERSRLTMVTQELIVLPNLQAASCPPWLQAMFWQRLMPNSAVSLSLVKRMLQSRTLSSKASRTELPSGLIAPARITFLPCSSALAKSVLSTTSLRYMLQMVALVGPVSRQQRFPVEMEMLPSSEKQQLLQVRLKISSERSALEARFSQRQLQRLRRLVRTMTQSLAWLTCILQMRSLASRVNCSWTGYRQVTSSLSSKSSFRVSSSKRTTIALGSFSTCTMLRFPSARLMVCRRSLSSKTKTSVLVARRVLAPTSSSCWMAGSCTLLQACSAISHWPSPYRRLFTQLKPLPQPHSDRLMFSLPSSLRSSKVARKPRAMSFILLMSSRKTAEVSLHLAAPQTRALSYSSASSCRDSSSEKKRLSAVRLKALRSEPSEQWQTSTVSPCFSAVSTPLRLLATLQSQRVSMWGCRLMNWQSPRAISRTQSWLPARKRICCSSKHSKSACELLSTDLRLTFIIQLQAQLLSLPSQLPRRRALGGPGLVAHAPLLDARARPRRGQRALHEAVEAFGEGRPGQDRLLPEELGERLEEGALEFLGGLLGGRVLELEEAGLVEGVGEGLELSEVLLDAGEGPAAGRPELELQELLLLRVGLQVAEDVLPQLLVPPQRGLLLRVGALHEVEALADRPLLLRELLHHLLHELEVQLLNLMPLAADGLQHVHAAAVLLQAPLSPLHELGEVFDECVEGVDCGEVGVVLADAAAAEEGVRRAALAEAEEGLRLPVPLAETLLQLEIRNHYILSLLNGLFCLSKSLAPKTCFPLYTIFPFVEGGSWVLFS